MGVIDTLGIGFSTINKKLTLVLVPIILDLFFWLGPRLSVKALQLGSLLDRMPADYRSMLDQLVQAMQTFNWFALLGIGVPNLLGSNADVSNLFSAPVVEIHSRLLFLGLAGAIAIFGLFLTSLYLTLIAQVVRDGRLVWRKLYRVLVYWSRLLQLMVLIGLVALIFTIPFAFIAGFAAQLSVGIVWFLGLLLQGPMLLLFLIFIFAAMAIFIDDARPGEAIGRGMAVLLRSFWSSLGLLVLVATVFLGFPIIWQTLLRTPYGVCIAILGNAYIGTALATAIMLFYKDRAAHLVKATPSPTGRAGR